MLGTHFIELPVAVPPMLPEMVGVSDSQYFALYYQGSKATWSNGRATATFSYYAVYAPLIEHITLAIHLEPYNLGSDDELPEHAILCDCVHRKMYVGARTKKSITSCYSRIPKSHLPCRNKSWKQP